MRDESGVSLLTLTGRTKCRHSRAGIFAPQSISRFASRADATFRSQKERGKLALSAIFIEEYSRSVYFAIESGFIVCGNNAGIVVVRNRMIVISRAFMDRYLIGL